MKKKNNTPIGIKIALTIGKVIFILAILINVLVVAVDVSVISDAKDAGPFIYYNGDYFDPEEIIEAYTAARNQALLVLLVLVIILVGLFVLSSVLKKKYGVTILDQSGATGAPPTAMPVQSAQSAKEGFCPKCGTKRKAGEPFCGNCGEKME